MALFEKLLAGLAPGWALNRARARLAWRNVNALYEGAAVNRRTRGWRADRRGPNAEIRPALKTLRDRSRDLVRNNPYAAAGLDLVVSYQVGAGIVPRSATKDTDLDRRVDELWAGWAAKADLSGRTDVYGLQSLLARARAESGEALAQIVPLPAQEARRRGMVVPVALQVMEADHLDDAFDGAPRAGDVIRQGIEFDGYQTPIAYHILPQHPAEVDAMLGGVALAVQRVRIPADRMMHLFRQDRPGQIRGVPDLAPVMTRLRSLDDLEDAALEQAKVQACLAALVISQAPAAAGPLEGAGAADTDDAEEGHKTLYPGMFERLLPGEDVKFLQPSGAGGFDPLARHQLHAIATGWGLTYDLLTGDLSGANYSSLRAGRLAFKRRLERVQWHCLVPQMCAPIWRAFIDAAVMAGLLPRRAGGYPAEWAPPVFEMVDPLKDALAQKQLLRMGLLTWPQAVAQMGWEPRRQAEEIAAWNGIADDLGLVLDGDPRRTAGSGGAQAVDDAPPAPDEDGAAAPASGRDADAAARPVTINLAVDARPLAAPATRKVEVRRGADGTLTGHITEGGTE